MRNSCGKSLREWSEFYRPKEKFRDEKKVFQEQQEIKKFQ